MLRISPKDLCDLVQMFHVNHRFFWEPTPRTIRLQPLLSETERAVWRAPVSGFVLSQINNVWTLTWRKAGEADLQTKSGTLSQMIVEAENILNEAINKSIL